MLLFQYLGVDAMEIQGYSHRDSQIRSDQEVEKDLDTEPDEIQRLYEVELQHLP